VLQFREATRFDERDDLIHPEAGAVRPGRIVSCRAQWPTALVPAGRHAIIAPLARPVSAMLKFLLWLILFALCWPLALLALVLWPIVWLLSLPFRLLGVAFEGVFSLLRAVLTLPARLLGAPR
jgi:hypothetical protein